MRQKSVARGCYNSHRSLGGRPQNGGRAGPSPNTKHRETPRAPMRRAGETTVTQALRFARAVNCPETTAPTRGNLMGAHYSVELKDGQQNSEREEMQPAKRLAHHVGVTSMMAAALRQCKNAQKVLSPPGVELCSFMARLHRSNHCATIG